MKIFDLSKVSKGILWTFLDSNYRYFFLKLYKSNTNENFQTNISIFFYYKRIIMYLVNKTHAILITSKFLEIRFPLEFMAFAKLVITPNRMTNTILQTLTFF